MMHIEFKVIKTDPPEQAIVTQDTVIHYGGEPIQTTDDETDILDARSNTITPNEINASQVNRIYFAVLSIPFIVVRLVYTLLNGLDTNLLNFDGSTESTITRAAMVILMEIFILGLFSIAEFFAPFLSSLEDKIPMIEEGSAFSYTPFCYDMHTFLLSITQN
jgi:hypothetical protein